MLPEIAAIIMNYVEELWQAEQHTKDKLLQQLKIPDVCFGFRTFYDYGSVQSRIRLLNGRLTCLEFVNLTIILLALA